MPPDLTEMQLDGRGPEVHTMIMREASGDVTTTTFQEVNAARRFSAAELTSLFQI